MSWIAEPEAAVDSFEAVLSQRPELATLYRTYYGGLWEKSPVPADILELARLRIAEIHECDAELAIQHEAAGLSQAQRDALANWQASPLFSDGQRAALGLAERIVWEHHQITDEESGAVRQHLGDAGLVAFTVAISLFDANCRLKLALGVTPPAAGVDQLY